MPDSWESNKAIKAQYHCSDLSFHGKWTGKPIFKILKEKGFFSMKEEKKKEIGKVVSCSLCSPLRTSHSHGNSSVYPFGWSLLGQLLGISQREMKAGMWQAFIVRRIVQLQFLSHTTYSSCHAQKNPDKIMINKQKH